MYDHLSVMSPLPKITVQHRVEKVNIKITQMIKKLGKRREMEILEERSQGFWMEDEVKLTLDRIKMRTHKMKTMPLSSTVSEMAKHLESRRHKTFNKNPPNRRRADNKYYLPELKQMVNNRESQNNRLIIAKRRKILHLLILGLNRRNLGRLYEALDIILLASFYFEKDDEQRVLKSICLSLISKLHKEIRKQTMSLKKKSKLNKKRKSLTVLNYLSRENFMENFMMKLRKTKLVGQFSYAESKHRNNFIRKINAKCDVVIPKPEEIFEPELEVKNYEYIAITVDDYTNTFPYEYPKSLSQKIDTTEYRRMICKLNGLLFPQSKCYSFSSIIKLFYLPFLMIFMLMLGFSILRTFITGEIGRIILICGTILLVLFLGIKISVEESGYTNYIEIKDKMKAYLAQWEEKYSKDNIKFKMGENVDAIFIVFPSQFPDSSLVSSKLTEIQEVDQNNTEIFTDSKGNRDMESIRGARRTGSRFEENGNIMKKRTFSRFMKEQSGLKRKNTLTNSCHQEEDEEKVRNEKSLSEKKVEIDDPNYTRFLIQAELKKTASHYEIQKENSQIQSQYSNALKMENFESKRSLAFSQNLQNLPSKKSVRIVTEADINDKSQNRKPTIKKIPGNSEKNQSDNSWRHREESKKMSSKHIKIEQAYMIPKKTGKKEENSVSHLITPQSNLEQK